MARKKSHSRRSPTQKRSLRLTMDLIEGGFKVLDQFGLEKFSTNKVAEVTGVSIGSLYQYFTDKEDLLLRMIEVTTTDILSEVTEKMNSIEFERPQDFVSCLVVEAYSLFMKKKGIGHMLFLSGRDNKGQMLIKKSREDFISKLTLYYNERFPYKSESEKESRMQNLEVLVISFLSLVQSILIEKRSKKEADGLMFKFSHLARAAVA